MADEDAAALGARDDGVDSSVAQHLQIGSGQHHVAALARAATQEGRSRAARGETVVQGEQIRGDLTRHRRTITGRRIEGRGRLCNRALGIHAEVCALGVGRGDQRLLFGHGGVGRLEPLHDLEFGVFEVALATSERRDLALQTLRLFGVARGGESARVTCGARVDHGDVGLDARHLCAQIVTGAQACRELPRQLLASCEQLLHARGLRRILAGVVGLADTGIEKGHLDEAVLIGGAGIHASQPTVAHRRRNGRALAFNDRSNGGKVHSMSVLRTKSVEQSIADTEEPEYRLKKSLSALDLTVFGIGVVIGAGIFTLTGRAAHEVAGPAIVVSFVVAAIACALAALCYAEFASTVPVSGSAYTFSYSSLGELFAWIIGWDLILEMFLGASVVAQGWSAYLGTLMEQLGMPIPAEIGYGGTVDLMAILLVLVLGGLMSFGIKESLRVNLVLVAVKLFIVLFVIVAGVLFIDPANWVPFVPEAAPRESASGLSQPLLQFLSGIEPTAFGVGGIFAGAALVFFAYIGFDVVATTAEETRNPQRDMPIGIIASLAICTVLYCAVAFVVTGMVPYQDLDPAAALANAFAFHGQAWMATLISAGAVAGLTTVVLTLLIGATRIIFAMSRDALLPIGLAKVHPRFRTPWLISLVVTVIVAVVAGFTPIGLLEEMVNIGTLSAFVMVSIGVIVLRRRRPDLPRTFRVPFNPWLPGLSAAICVYLMLNLTVETWLRFLIWLAVGFVIYFAYSQKRSRIGQPGYIDPSLPHVVAHRREGEDETT